MASAVAAVLYSFAEPFSHFEFYFASSSSLLVLLCSLARSLALYFSLSLSLSLSFSAVSKPPENSRRCLYLSTLVPEYTQLRLKLKLQTAWHQQGSSSRSFWSVSSLFGDDDDHVRRPAACPEVLE